MALPRGLTAARVLLALLAVHRGGSSPRRPAPAAPPARSRRQRSHGQGLVEFALVFPVLAMLIFAGIDLSRAYLIHNAITNSAREGARYGIVQPTRITSADAADPANVKWRVLHELNSATVGAADIDVAYVKRDATTLDATSASGRATYLASPVDYPYVRVTVHHAYHPLTPLVGALSGNGISLSASTTMAIE